MIEFSNRPRLRIPLNQAGGKQALLYSLRYIAGSRGNKVAFPEMIEFATKEAFGRDRGSRPGVPKYLIVITDDNVPFSEQLRAAVDEAEKAGLNVYVVNIGDTTSTEGLNVLAPVAKNRYVVDDVRSLNGVADRLVKNILIDVGERK